MAETTKLVQSALIGDVVEGLGLAVFVSDDDLRLIAVNEAAATLLGHAREELLQLRVSDVVDRTPARLRRASREIEEAGGRAGSAVLKHKDGTKIGVRFVSLATAIAGRLPVLLTIASAAESDFLDRLGAKLEPERRAAKTPGRRRSSVTRG